LQRLAMPRPRRSLRGAQQRADEELRNDLPSSAAVLDTAFTPLGAPVAEGWLPKPQVAKQLQPSVVVAAEHAVRRRTQEADAVVTAWDQVPQTQKQLMPKTSAQTDLWATLASVLHNLYGPRCNATHGCARHGYPPRGRCLNITGGDVYGYDQNGTCHCHPWFTTDDCSVVLANGVTCAGIPNMQQCQTVRENLFTCGLVNANDYLPSACVQRGLTVVECGEAGYMHGVRNQSGISNLVGRPDSALAALSCDKCMARGAFRSETFAKLCNRAEILVACQRYEDATAQRLCNYCGMETAGSVMPQRGRDRSCSYYRGTCMGSVEKRIRGIVPPNLDIIGHTAYGGLRYCRQPSTFTSVQHYYTDADIMMVGETCRLGTMPMYEGWDWTKQHDLTKVAPMIGSSTQRERALLTSMSGSMAGDNTMRDRFGTACEQPYYEATCPIARNCIDASLCYTDTPDWLDMDHLVQYIGLGVLRYYADDGSGLCNAYFGSDTAALDAAIAASQARQATLAGGLTDEGPPPVIPCTFETHRRVLRPTVAASIADWPFLSQEYLDAYTHVDWSTESQAIPPPPPSPPGSVNVG